jgi:hypothetical protein
VEISHELIFERRNFQTLVQAARKYTEVGAETSFSFDSREKVKRGERGERNGQLTLRKTFVERTRPGRSRGRGKRSDGKSLFLLPDKAQKERGMEKRGGDVSNKSQEVTRAKKNCNSEEGNVFLKENIAPETLTRRYFATSGFLTKLTVCSRQYQSPLREISLRKQLSLWKIRTQSYLSAIIDKRQYIVQARAGCCSGTHSFGSLCAVPSFS